MNQNATGTIDEQGHSTLNVMAKADKFNEWMYDAVRPFVSGTVLEIGSGIGNMSEYLFSSAKQVYLSDYNPDYLEILNGRFAGRSNLGKILSIDLNDPEFDEKFTLFFGSFDTIVALNVIEHIASDELAIQNCTKLLRKDGRLIILVPAYQGLYNRFDKELGHFKRYTRNQVRALLTKELAVVHSRYFNFAGIFGWFLSGTVLRRKSIPSSQMTLFNSLVPLFKFAEKVLSGRTGLSVIVVAKKL